MCRDRRRADQPDPVSRPLREAPLRLGDEVPVGGAGDQPGRGERPEGGHRLRRGEVQMPGFTHEFDRR